MECLSEVYRGFPSKIEICYSYFLLYIFYVPGLFRKDIVVRLIKWQINQFASAFWIIPVSVYFFHFSRAFTATNKLAVYKANPYAI
jgi:hypothetical protein